MRSATRSRPCCPPARGSRCTTSREPLALAAEYTYRLAPLPLPGPGPDVTGPDVADVPSVAVFLDRATRVRPDFRPTRADLTTIAEIVRRLDGMPLAIELAAGRLSTFSLTDLRDRLDRALDLLAGGRTRGDVRHRTLRATVEWSYELLGDEEQRLFRHLAVFVDGVDLDTAEQVASGLGIAEDPGTVLARLVDASMIEPVFLGPTRYRMLETLRAFGLDRLAASGETGAAQQRLVRWAVGLVAWIGTTVTTEREPEADSALRRELPNLRAAWRLARADESPADAAAMVSALIEAIAYRDLIEVRAWADELVDDPALATCPQARAVLGAARGSACCRGRRQRWPAGRSPRPWRSWSKQPSTRRGSGTTSGSPPSARPMRVTSTGREH